MNSFGKIGEIRGGETFLAASKYSTKRGEWAKPMLCTETPLGWRIVDDDVDFFKLKKYKLVEQNTNLLAAKFARTEMRSVRQRGFSVFASVLCVKVFQFPLQRLECRAFHWKREDEQLEFAVGRAAVGGHSVRTGKKAPPYLDPYASTPA